MSGILLILVGPSGAGKDSLAKLMEARTDFVLHATSYTTRRMRVEDGECQGRPYWFVSAREYEELQTQGRLYNDETVGGERYGFDLIGLRQRLADGQHVMIQLLHEWAMKIRDLLQGLTQVLVVQLRLPSDDEQIRRLRDRQEPEESIVRRMAQSQVQNPPIEGCDLVLVNERGRLEAVYVEVLKLVTTARQAEVT